MTTTPAGALAIDGGSAVRSAPLAPWPSFDEEMVEAASRVLRSGRVNYWTGDEGRSFEREFAKAAGCEYAIAVANGTVAIELALMALGIGEGDDVVVPSRTFVGTATPVLMRGARPIFADVDEQTQTLSAQTVAQALTPKTRAVIVVHLAGWPADVAAIREICKAGDICVIEDCAQAHGAKRRDKPVGCLGDIAAFSFCQDKIMTTAGEGGMVTTNRADLWERAWAYKDHGKSYAAVYKREHPPGFRWLHESPGTNWRMSEVQSAVGRVALQRLPDWVKRRRFFAQTLNQRLGALPVVRTTRPEDSVEHSYYKYYAFVDPARLRPQWSRDRIMGAVNAEGVPCYSGSCSEIYLEKVFPEQMRPKERLPVARSLAETSLMLQVHPTLSGKDIDDACQAMEKVCAAATR